MDYENFNSSNVFNLYFNWGWHWLFICKPTEPQVIIEVTPDFSEYDIEHLIACMETARDSHQYCVDRRHNWHIRWYYIYADEEWVEIYRQVIEVLESLK